MKPFFLLITVFVICLFVTRFQTGDYLHFLSGRIAMSIMLVFTAVGHFIFTKGMAMMVPDFLRYKKGIVYFSGLLEILLAVGLLLPDYLQVTAWALIAFLILTIPSNIKAANEHIDYQKATNHGPGPKYLWFRIPLQLFFIAWVCVFAFGF